MKKPAGRRKPSVKVKTKKTSAAPTSSKKKAVAVKKVAPKAEKRARPARKVVKPEPEVEIERSPEEEAMLERLKTAADGVKVHQRHLEFLCRLLCDPQRRIPEAYGPMTGKTVTHRNREILRAGGLQILKRPEIKRLREVIEKEIQAQEMAGAVMDVHEKRRFLARVVRVKRSDWAKPENEDLIQEWREKQTEDSHEITIKIPAKIAAIETDNDLAGHGAKFRVQEKAGNALMDLVLAIRGGR